MNIKKWVKKNFNYEKDYILITGATTGIGREYLEKVSQLKCNSIIVSNEEDKNNQVAKEVENKYAVKCIPIFCDLSELSSVKKLQTKLDDYSIAVFISNAGFGIKGNFLDIEETKYQDIIGVNVMAPTVLTYYTLNKMVANNRGVVITIASINVVSPIPKNSVYTATKSFLYSFSLAITKEYEFTNILFQTVLPGTTDTPFHEKQGANPSALTMTAEMVAERSLNHLDSKILIPNKIDRFSFPIVSRLPVFMRMELAAFALKKRLGV